MAKIAVIGAGLIGRAWSISFARAGYEVALWDVDAKLVAMARHLNGRIVTNDYNLNKIAQLRGVDVININDLANGLKPVVLPGETLQVKVLRPGEDAGQGVGYLDDGTSRISAARCSRTSRGRTRRRIRSSRRATI